MRDRLKKVITKACVLVAAGFVYWLLARLGLGLVCPIHRMTGLYCPGCGITRMFISLGTFDLAAAAHNNLAVLLLLPLGTVWYLFYAIRYIRTGTRQIKKAETILLWCAIGGLLIFGILRNLPCFPMLRPIG